MVSVGLSGSDGSSGSNIHSTGVILNSIPFNIDSKLESIHWLALVNLQQLRNTAHEMARVQAVLDVLPWALAAPSVQTCPSPATPGPFRVCVQSHPKSVPAMHQVQREHRVRAWDVWMSMAALAVIKHSRSL